MNLRVGIELMIEGFWERVMLFGFAIMLIFALHSMLSDGVIESGPHRFTREDHPGMFWTLVVMSGVSIVVFVLYAFRKEK